VREIVKWVREVGASLLASLLSSLLLSLCEVTGPPSAPVASQVVRGRVRLPVPHPRVLRVCLSASPLSPLSRGYSSLLSSLSCV